MDPMSVTTTIKHSRILITNDDGIHAPGIKVLEDIAQTFSDDVWVVAPDRERSGAGHSVSLSNPIRSRQLDTRHFQITGTPTDCVLMGVHEILRDRRPDYVLSGINSGANLGEDVSYSGTIAAAMEGCLLGMRSIALSQLRGPDGFADFTPARAFAPQLIEQLIELDEWPDDSFININFPHAAVDEISGFQLTTQGRRPPGSFSIESRIDTRAQPYYWINIDYTDGSKLDGSDLAAIAQKAVSITPLRMDFTNRRWRDSLAQTMSLAPT